jgi:hypothetical protein
MTSADGQTLHQCTLTMRWMRPKQRRQIGPYQRWRRHVDAGWLPCGPGEDTRRHAWTHARTACLSALTQFSPIFRLGMNRSSLTCLFGSGRLRGRVRTRSVCLGRPAGDALSHQKILLLHLMARGTLLDPVRCLTARCWRRLCEWSRRVIHYGNDGHNGTSLVIMLKRLNLGTYGW